MSAKIRRCPLCHRANEARAWQCNCGYEFGQTPEKAIELLLSQRRNARIMFPILLATALGALACFITSIGAGAVMVVTGVAFGALAVHTSRVGHRLVITRESLRQLRAKQLPTAKLLRAP